MLPDVLRELDALPLEARLVSLIENCLAGNLFDWGARACVEMYHNGTILDMYRRAVLRSVAHPEINQLIQFRSQFASSVHSQIVPYSHVAPT